MYMNISVKAPVRKTANHSIQTEADQLEEKLAIEKLIARSLSYEPPNIDKFNAKMLMYSFLSEVEIITDERNISRKELAALVGTSAAYITGLYRGNHIASLEFLAKLAKALNIEFRITATAP